MATIYRISMTQQEYTNYIAIISNIIPANYEIFINNAAPGTPNLYTGTGTNTPVSGNVGGASGGSAVFEDWAAGKNYAIGDKVLATVAIESIGVGSRLRRKTAGTARTTFDTTEVLAWDEMIIDDDVVPKTAIQTVFQSTPTDTAIASEKLVKDNLNLKMALYQLGHPFFTAATTHGHKVTHSSAFGAAYEGWKAFQESSTSVSEWATASIATGNVTLELPQTAIFNRITLKGRAAGIEYPTRWKLEGSNDNTTYTLLLDKTAADESLQTEKTFDFTNTTPFKFYRFSMIASIGTNPGLNLIRWFHKGVNILPDLSSKVDVVSGKQLSTEDYSTAEKTKLSGIMAGAEINLQADFNQVTTTADDFIKNKPDLTLKEDKVNKRITFQTTPTDIAYPSEKLVKNNLDNKANSIHAHGESDVTNLVIDLAAKEITANKRTTFQTTPTDTAYASEKLVKDSLDGKENDITSAFTRTDLYTAFTIAVQSTGVFEMPFGPANLRTPSMFLIGLWDISHDGTHAWNLSLLSGRTLSGTVIVNGGGVISPGSGKIDLYGVTSGTIYGTDTTAFTGGATNRTIIINNVIIPQNEYLALRIIFTGNGKIDAIGAVNLTMR